jgi:hypothetical protein
MNWFRLLIVVNFNGQEKDLPETVKSIAKVIV